MGKCPNRTTVYFQILRQAPFGIRPCINTIKVLFIFFHQCFVQYKPQHRPEKVYLIKWPVTHFSCFSVVSVVFYVAPPFVRLRHGDRQHGGLRSAEGGSAGEGAGSHAEETPPPERKET